MDVIYMHNVGCQEWVPDTQYFSARRSIMKEHLLLTLQHLKATNWKYVQKHKELQTLLTCSFLKSSK